MIGRASATICGDDPTLSITGITGPTGAWNGEGLLVVTHDALLPQYCVKCGGPASEPPLKRNFSWYPPWYAILIFFGVLPYVLAAMFASKRMTVHLPLCPRHLERYKGLRVASILLLIGGIPEMIAAGTWLPEDYQGLGIFSGFLALLAGLLCLSSYHAVLRPKYIDDSFGYFRKVNVNFLNLLPPRPPNIAPR